MVRVETMLRKNRVVRFEDRAEWQALNVWKLLRRGDDLVENGNVYTRYISEDGTCGAE